MAREMKDSGIAWLGDIPFKWELQRNKNCFDCSKDIVGEKSVETQLLSLTTKGIKEKRAEDSAGKVPESYDTYQIVAPEDIVMCLFDLDVSAVFSGFSPFWGMISPAYKVLKCRKERIMPKFADYWFSFIFDGRKFKHYSKNLRYTLNYDEFAVLPIVLPDIDEQQRITAFLDTECERIDAVIEQTRASIEEYKKLKQSVITQAVTKGIRPNRPMKDSDLGWVDSIPNDWIIIPSKYLFMNSDSRRKENDEQMTASQQYGIITQSEYMRLTGSKVVFANKGLEDWKHVDPFDFVISLRSFQGGLEMSETTGCITWHYIVLKPRRPIYSYYYKWLFKTGLYIKALQRTCNYIRDGQDLRYSNFEQVPLFMPSIEEQKEIADYLDEKCAMMNTLIEQKTRLLDELETYKKSLIYEYVTGKKEVPYV